MYTGHLSKLWFSLIKKGKKSKKRQWIIMIGAYVVVFAVMIVIFVRNPPGS